MGIVSDITRKSELAGTTEVERRVYIGTDGFYDIEVEVEYLDAKRCEPVDMARECSVGKHIELACRSLIGAECPPAEGAVYVVSEEGDTGHCKIGVATDPAKRLLGLQTGNWRQLKLNSLFWIVQNDAYLLEGLSHGVAKQLGTLVRGEWVKATPQEAALIVATVAHSAPLIRVASSALWLRQRKKLARIAWDMVNGCGTRWEKPELFAKPVR